MLPEKHVEGVARSDDIFAGCSGFGRSALIRCCDIGAAAASGEYKESQAASDDCNQVLIARSLPIGVGCPFYRQELYVASVALHSLIGGVIRVSARSVDFLRNRWHGWIVYLLKIMLLNWRSVLRYFLEADVRLLLNRGNEKITHAIGS